jgi:hypothetical protein
MINQIEMDLLPFTIYDILLVKKKFLIILKKNLLMTNAISWEQGEYRKIDLRCF